MRSFLDVFPHVSLWTTEFHEMLLIGSFEPIELDAPHIAARFDQPEVAAALREVGIASPAALLGTWVTDRAGLEPYVDGAPPVTDDRLRIEYATWVRQKEFRHVLPGLLALRTMPLLRGADDTLLAAVADEYNRLLRFYDAGSTLQANQLTTQAFSRIQALPTQACYLRILGTTPWGLSSWDGRWEQIASRDP